MKITSRKINFQFLKPMFRFYTGSLIFSGGIKENIGKK